jgi:ATP-dependent Lhr-like helicase
LRWLLVPGWSRKSGGVSSGRWTRLGPGVGASQGERAAPEQAEFVARQLLRRMGVIFRRAVSRERIPLPWRDIARACRALEARGEIRGGRFVAGFDGEQYASSDAVSRLRQSRRSPPAGPLRPVGASDPLHLEGVLTPGEAAVEARVG